jgi:predicted DNA repair protein MutK
MAAVSVFVDDAIRGELPLVCAKTGAPADLKVRVRQPVGGGIPVWAWFLLFLGPLGIVALVLAAVLAPGAEYLIVRIPETEASFERERQMQRWRLAALGAGVAVPMLALFTVGMFPMLWLATGVAFFLAAGALTFLLWRQSVGVSIDVTRRWVTLTNVHPDFVDAVDSQVTKFH